MKSKELIKQLRQLDPTGEIEVVAGGRDIYFCAGEPYYWDGIPDLLIRDEKLKPFWHVIGMEQMSSGSKIELNLLDLEDIVFEDDDNKYIYKGNENFMKRVEKYREEREKVMKEIESEKVDKLNEPS